MPLKTKLQMEWFRLQQWAFKYMEPSLQVAFAQAVKGTPLMPRDLFAMSQAGRFVGILRLDGRKIYPMSGINDVSDALDFLGQFEGMLLVRTAEGWRGLEAPDEANWVLTSTGPDTPPLWLPKSTGGGTGQFSCNVDTGTNTGALACKGALLVPMEDMDISACMFGITEVTGATYRASIYSLSGNTIVANLGDTPPYSPSPAQTIKSMHYFTDPIRLTKDQRYALCLRRTDSTGTALAGARASNMDPMGLPIQQYNTLLAIASTNPAPGQTFSQFSNVISYGVTWSPPA